MKEFIDQDKCTLFELMMLYIMCYLKEDDLNEDMKDDGFMSLGEMEKYSRFGIDWTTISKIEELIYLEDDDSRWEYENLFQEVAQKAHKLYNYLKDHKLLDGAGKTKDCTRYAITNVANQD